VKKLVGQLVGWLVRWLAGYTVIHATRTKSAKEQRQRNRKITHKKKQNPQKSREIQGTHKKCIKTYRYI